MIRYVLTFPPEARVTQEFLSEMTVKLKEAVNKRQWQDVVFAYGATMVDLAPDRNRTAALVRRARALHR